MHSVPNLDNIKFLHPVGVSTFKYGVSIPVEAQTERMRAIEKGGKVPVTIFFGAEEPVVAEIRRLNNKPGHLQFRYENKAQDRLRQYLLAVFGSQSGGSLLEVEEVAPFTFIFKPILKDTSPCLRISDMLLHRLDKGQAKQFAEIEQIEGTLAAVKYDVGFNQSDYNGRINEGLVGQGWNREQRVVSELGLKCDFEKNGIWVEVEFGNARSYYQDYVKFMLAWKYRNARLGLLLCPTTSFAALLCELGRQRARENVVRERPAAYSGMMSYEKAVRELPFLGFMFEMPIVVAGVGVSGR
ncbi:MAG: BglII/BstYI family type II restriction endonuclease [Desulfuromonadaceae bacterium]|nr:BglII/BstYI family type II restriction endonuclease [Desulfuromonadaceae bacterium]